MNNEIIITFSLYGIGGAQRRAFALANRFADKGYTVYVVAVWGRDSTIGSENYYGVSEKINLGWRWKLPVSGLLLVGTILLTVF